MQPDAATNSLIFRLLQDLKLYKAKTLSQNSALLAIAKMTPQELSALTMNQIYDLEVAARQDAVADVNAESSELEQALSSGNDVLRSLDSFLRKPI